MRHRRRVRHRALRCHRHLRGARHAHQQARLAAGVAGALLQRVGGDRRRTRVRRPERRTPDGARLDQRRSALGVSDGRGPASSNTRDSSTSSSCPPGICSPVLPTVTASGFSHWTARLAPWNPLVRSRHHCRRSPRKRISPPDARCFRMPARPAMGRAVKAGTAAVRLLSRRRTVRPSCGS